MKQPLTISRRQRERADRHAAILAAAREVFFEQGILVAKAGYGSDLLTIPVCVAGQTGAAGIYCEGGSI